MKEEKKLIPYNFEGWFTLYIPNSWQCEEEEDLLNIFASSSASAFFVSDTGRVGVGTTTPAGDVQIADATTTTMYIGDLDRTGCIAIGDSDGAGITYITFLNGVMTMTTTSKPAVCK